MQTLRNGMETYSHAEMLDKHVGPVGSPEREEYEAELKKELAEPQHPNMALLNHHNVLLWYDAAGETAFAPPKVSGLLSSLVADAPLLVVKPGEAFGFYANLTAGVALPAGGFTLKNAADATVATFTHTRADISFGGLLAPKTHTYATLTLPGSPAPGLYRIAVGSLRSSVVEVIEAADADELAWTAFVQVRHPRPVGNFMYPYLPGDWTQSFRLRLVQREVSAQTDVSVYIRSSDGGVSNLQGTARKFVTLETAPTDEAGHDALHWLFLHDVQAINGRVYQRRPEGSYRILTNTDAPLSPGEATLYVPGSAVLVKA